MPIKNVLSNEEMIALKEIFMGSLEEPSCTQGATDSYFYNQSKYEDLITKFSLLNNENKTQVIHFVDALIIINVSK